MVQCAAMEGKDGITVVELPCTAQELEDALHAACDHDGRWGWTLDAERQIYYNEHGALRTRRVLALEAPR